MHESPDIRESLTFSGRTFPENVRNTRITGYSDSRQSSSWRTIVAAREGPTPTTEIREPDIFSTAST